MNAIAKGIVEGAKEALHEFFLPTVSLFRRTSRSQTKAASAVKGGIRDTQRDQALQLA